MNVTAEHPDHGTVTITEVVAGPDLHDPDMRLTAPGAAVAAEFTALARKDHLARFRLADGTRSDHWLSAWPAGAAALAEAAAPRCRM